MGGITVLARFSRGIEMNLWRISEKPKKTVGNNNIAQTITPQTGLNPPARVNINRKIALAIARVLKDIE
jgi:hypothetical protein